MTKKYNMVQPSIRRPSPIRVRVQKFKPADMRNPRRIKRKLEFRELLKALNEMINMSMRIMNQKPYPIDEDQYWETNVLTKAVQQIQYLERQEKSQEVVDEATRRSDVNLMKEAAKELAKLNKVRKINH